MKVLKFGGSSVAKPERIEGIIEILKSYYSKGEKFAVVFSAFGGVTDSLIEMATLAADGDEAYLQIFEAFCERHNGSAKKLLNDNFDIKYNVTYPLMKNLTSEQQPITVTPTNLTKD